MPLKIVGTGLGRTGTMSLKRALEMLGFGPCHHMMEVFQHPESVPLWIEAAKGRPSWDAIFKDYASAVDYPSCKFWRELTAYYSDAYVLHSVRDPNRWFDSTQATIFSETSPALNAPPPMNEFFAAILGDFGDRIHDRDFMIAYFKRHTEEVERTIPKKRLLVYEAGQGWEPLCSFLGVSVPSEPFPLVNTREEFIARRAAQTKNA
ncbi:MAG: sulfotransferase family protein [Alphaproteobacteria bacterium]|nr:sulfotransferase family protein [Alphaproteobacteria bacterium]